MLHPDILNMYLFERTQCQINAIDACDRTAAWFRIDIATLARFILAMGIDGGRPHNLQLLT